MRTFQICITKQWTDLVSGISVPSVVHCRFLFVVRKPASATHPESELGDTYISALSDLLVRCSLLNHVKCCWDLTNKYGIKWTFENTAHLAKLYPCFFLKVPLRSTLTHRTRYLTFPRPVHSAHNRHSFRLSLHGLNIRSHLQCISIQFYDLTNNWLKICHTCIGTNKHLLQNGDKCKQQTKQIRKGKFIQESFYILYINRLKNATEEEINGWNPSLVILTTNL